MNYCLSRANWTGIGFAFLFCFNCSTQAHAQAKWKTNLLQYINTHLAKQDGGYGWDDQYDSHIEPTFAVIGILRDIDQLPANKTPLIEFVRTHHPQRTANKETGPSGFDDRILLYYQIQSLAWLGDDLSAFKKEVSGWKSDAANLYNYESHNYGVFDEEVMTPVCRNILQIPTDDIKPAFIGYLEKRKRSNGSFNNAPRDNGDGNILNTWWGLHTLQLLGETSNPLHKETIGWIQSCQLKNGGFTHQPHPLIGGNDDVIYAWAAIKSLQLLHTKPSNAKASIRYLLSLRNADGGFGNRPGIPSTPISTYYAVDALKALDAFSSLDPAPAPRAISQKSMDYTGLKIFTAQFEAQGSGSPQEAVMLADSLHIHLWGAKNGNAQWSTRAQQIADKKKVPVTFFYADEPYGKNVSVPGMGTFSHVLDYIAPPNTPASELAKETPWADYRSNFVEPLMKANGALILQISNSEALARMILDESVKKGGYAGISTIHFNQNFLFFLPFLYQYRHQLPMVALQDAHGEEAWWWSNELLHYRTLFLAKEPTYAAMIEALKNNWVVAVRHDSVSDYKTRMLGGAPGIQEYMLTHQDQWKWWTGEKELVRPWAAITVLHPSDSFEVAIPDEGIAIRIRCWWETTRQIMRTPLVKLEQLRIDNIPAEHQYIETKDRRGGIADSYYLYAFKNPSPGTHIVQASLRNIKDNSVRTETIKFEIK